MMFMNMIHPKTGQAQRRSARRRSAFLATVAALTLVVGGRATAATILSAGKDSSCGASSCFNSQGTYAITFSASAFSGPVDISKLLLSRSILGNLDSHFFSMNFELNGHLIGTWGDWNMSQVGGDQLSFFGSDLMWNPAEGDLVLVLDLVAPNGEKLRPDGAGGWYVPPGEGGFFYSGPGPDYGQGSGQSVVTSFVSPPPPPPVVGSGGDQPPPGDVPPPSSGSGPVPEPATWAMLVGGFGLAGAALRRRRAHKPIAAA